MSQANTVTDFVLRCMSDQKWWTYWDIQKKIKEKTDIYYSEPTISAAIRNLRKPKYQMKYGLPSGDIVDLRSRQEGKGNEYRVRLKERNG